MGSSRHGKSRFQGKTIRRASFGSVLKRFDTEGKGENMNKNTIFALCIGAVALMAAMTAAAQAPSRIHDLVPFYDDIRGGMCSMTNGAVGEIGPSTPAGTLLFNRTFRGQ